MKKLIFELKNLDVFRNETAVFKNLTLNFFAGENTAILGPNGAGKTTLMRLLTRETLPVHKDHSALKLFGKEHIHINEHRQRIGIVSHDYQEQHLTLATVEEVVISGYLGSIGIHAHHTVSKKMQTRATQILSELGIEHIAKRKFLSLSTGQKRRTLLARALVHDPEVLIFDEPTTGLDIAATTTLLNDLRDFCQKGKTLIVITHHLQEIIPEISRLIFLKEGKVVEEGKKLKLLTSEKLSKLFDVPVIIQKSKDYFFSS